MDMNLPIEYQQQIEQALRKKKLAEMLQERSMNYQGPQPMGPVAVKQSMFSTLANALGGVGGAYMAGKAGDDVNKVRGQYAQDEAADVASLTGMPELDAIKAGTNSKFSRSREIAKTMQTQAEKRRELKAGVYKDGGQTTQALQTLDGTPVSAPEPLKQPEVKWITDPNGKIIPQVTNYDVRGQGKVNLGSQGSNTSITNTMPGKEGEISLERESADLKDMQAKARAAQSTLANAERLTKVLEEGASVGGQAGTKQAARKLFQAFGIQTDESGPTDSARSLLGKGLLENAKQLGINPTDTDAKRIEQIVGTIDTDPASLPQLIAWMSGGAHKTLQDFGEFVNVKRKGQGAQKYPGLYDTLDIGIKQPESLFGPTELQVRILEALKQSGGDISKFQDKTGPVAANSTFTLGKPGAIAPKDPVVDNSPLSPDELKRYNDLKKKFGR